MPRTNGKAERFIQTSIKEWAYSQAYKPRLKDRSASGLGLITTIKRAHIPL
jgi:hypothetical protein